VSSDVNQHLQPANASRSIPSAGYQRAPLAIGYSDRPADVTVRIRFSVPW
jgi:hypothetical protein